MDVGDSVMLAGVTWKDGEVGIRLRRNGDASEVVPLDGFGLRYAAGLKHRRRCIGHRPFRDSQVAWQDCERAPLPDNRTCDRCSAIDATFASQLHHAHARAAGELDPSIRTHLQQPNVLYLAGFRDGSIKVGTSTTKRLYERLDEQGAWIAQIVAETSDGVSVRRLEEQVSVELGLPQSVSAHRKIAGLTSPLPDVRLRTELMHWTTTVHQLIQQHQDGVQIMSQEWSSTNVTDPVWQHVHTYPLKLESGNHDFAFVAASGRVCVVSRPGSSDRFVADLRPLFGLELIMSEVVGDDLAVQDSLF